MAAATAAVGAQGVLSWTDRGSSAADGWGLAASSNVMRAKTGNSAAGLRSLSLRLVPRRGPRAAQRRKIVGSQGPSALFDRGTDGSGSDGKKPEKKFITKEQEPEQYWQTADEKDGKNPMTTPLPYIVILGILSPFLILAVAFANSWIKIPVR